MDRKGFPYYILLLFTIISLLQCKQDDGAMPSTTDSTSYLALIDTFAQQNNITLLDDGNGLFYYPITQNPAGNAANSGILSIYYELETLGGSVIDIFDESDGDPLRVKQGAAAIYPVGLDQGLSLMRDGEEYGLILTPDLAYEDHGFTTIPPDSIVHFRVRVMLVENEIDILNQENTLINQYIIDAELNDTTEVPTDPIDRLPSGVVFKRLSRMISQPIPATGDSIAIEYILRSLDSTRQYDQRTTADPLRYEFGVSEIIAGFDAGVVNMRLGERALIIVPSALGYRGSAQVIPDRIKEEVFGVQIIPEFVLYIKPYEILVFEARLNEIY